MPSFRIAGYSEVDIHDETHWLDAIGSEVFDAYHRPLFDVAALHSYALKHRPIRPEPITIAERVRIVEPTDIIDETRSTFDELADAWRQETRFESSAPRLFSNWSYLRVIAMGPKVVPVILESL